MNDPTPVGPDEPDADRRAEGDPGQANTARARDVRRNRELRRERRGVPRGPTVPGSRPGPPRDARSYRPAPAPVALGTSSVFPETVAGSFDIAQDLGYDGMEVIVTVDPATQDLAGVERIVARHELPVYSVHAPTLLLTQTVWTLDPWEKLRRSAEMARALGASTVVVHPPFRWQREYASRFRDGIAELGSTWDVTFAVENLYPWRVAGRSVEAYLPHWDPTTEDYPALTLDVSHAAASGRDCLEMATAMGDRLAHVHLTDGTGSGRDEHLLPGRGTQPVAELLRYLGERDFGGAVVLEVNTRNAPDRRSRERWLAESLSFAREYLVTPLGPAYAVDADGRVSAVEA